jgi:hypothetical protein
MAVDLISKAEPKVPILVEEPVLNPNPKFEVIGDVCWITNGIVEPDVIENIVPVGCKLMLTELVAKRLPM